MKKSILLISISICNILTYGQVKIAIGIKGGLNYSKVDISNISTSGKTGYHGGVFGLFKFSKIGLQPEIIFSQQGSDLDVDSIWDTKYINIPIIIKLYIATGVNLQIGPQFGFLNKAELDGQDIKNLLKSSDISLAMGIGWDAPFNMIFNARYNLGLSNIDNNPGSETIKNQVFQISAGIKLFKLKK